MQQDSLEFWFYLFYTLVLCNIFLKKRVPHLKSYWLLHSIGYVPLEFTANFQEMVKWVIKRFLPTLRIVWHVAHNYISRQFRLLSGQISAIFIICLKLVTSFIASPCAAAGSGSRQIIAQ